MAIDLDAIFKLKKQAMKNCEERIQLAKFATVSNTMSPDDNGDFEDTHGISNILKKRHGL